VFLGGTVTGGLGGYSPVAVYAYDDADCGVNAGIGEGAVSAGAWSMAAEGTLETVWFKVKLEKDGDTGAYYGKPVSISVIPDTDRMDIVVPIEGYTVTFNASGDFFEGGGETVTREAPENGTVSLPASPQNSDSMYRFTGWRLGDGGEFTALTPIHGDTAVSAIWRIDNDDIVNYLVSAPGGDTAANPVPLTLSVNLANGGWGSILAAVASAGKYVALDVSGSTMSGTEFNPRTGNAGADKVVALVLPDAAESIMTRNNSMSDPWYMYNDYTSLALISGAGVKTISVFAFEGWPALTLVSLPAAETIGFGAFNSCTALTSVSLPVAQSIGDQAFRGCTALTSVSLPAAQTIGDYAFAGTALTSVSLPMAETIDDAAFYHCTALTTVSLPVAKTIGTASYSDPNYGAFRDCTALTSVSLPVAESIGFEAFRDCTALTSVSLPVAESIDYYAFDGCTALISVSLPVAKTIGAAAFRYCSALTSVSLPKAETIGNSVFSGCTALTSVSLPATPPGIGSGIFYYTSSGIITITVPGAAAVSAYTSAWGVTAVTVADGNTSVYGYSHKAVTIAAGP
jgi:hypothetical protein